MEGPALACVRVGLWPRRLEGLWMWEAGIMRLPRTGIASPLNIQETHTGWTPTQLGPAHFYALETHLINSLILPVALEVTGLLLLNLSA